MQLIASLKNQNALSAHRDDHKLILLEFGCFIARQSRRSRWTSLRQRFEITNDWISDADQPAEEARAQKEIEKMAARYCRNRPGLFVHRETSIREQRLLQVFVSASERGDVAKQRFKNERIGGTTNTDECPRRLCDYHAPRAQLDRGAHKIATCEYAWHTGHFDSYRK